MLYKILIVDDEPLVRICLKSYLDWNALGLCIVGEAADGEQALKMVDDLQPDILLLDIKMPKLDGIQVLERLQINHSEIKTIMLSSFNEFETVRHALRLKAFDYIHKPTMSSEDLKNTFSAVTSVLERERRNLKYKNDYIQKSKHDELIKQHLFKEIFTGEGTDTSKICKAFAEYGILLRSESVAILHFQIKDYNAIKSRYQSNASQRIQTAVMNLIQATCRSVQDWELVQAEENKYLLIIGKNKQNNESNSLNVLAEHIAINIHQFLNAEIVAGCSDFHPIQEITTCYQEGLSAFNYSSFMPHNQVSVYSEIAKEHRGELEEDTHIARALQYIHQHYSEQLSLEQVAKVVGLNKSYFSRIFKMKTGDNFVNYVNAYRIKVAARLLQKTNQKAYEIAYMVGYNNVEYFNQVFKRVMGVTPGEYR